MEIKYTMLPWMSNLSAGYIVSAALALLFGWMLFEKLFKSRNITMRRGTLAIISNTVWPLLLNVCVFALAFWYWAIPLSIGVAVIFVVIIRGELKTAREEEMEGAWGLFPAIRQIRAEAFQDLSIPEQMAYKARVKHQKVLWPLWAACIIILPFLLILLLEQLGVGDYLFSIHYFES